MAWLQSSAVLWRQLAVRQRARTATVVLVLGVMGWWLVIFGAVGLVVPSLAVPIGTPANVIAATVMLPLVVGSTVHIYAPPLQAWPIPVGRETFDDYQRAVRDDDEGALTELASRSGWLAVADQQQVRVVTVDGSAVQVELIDGQQVGGRGWLLARQLRP
jgi:hypothetical protein